MKKSFTLATVLFFLVGCPGLYASNAGIQPENTPTPIAISKMDVAHAKTLLESKRTALTEELGEKKTNRVFKQFNKLLDKALNKPGAFKPDSAKAEKFAERIEKAKAPMSNMTLVRVGVVLAIIGLLLWLLVSGIIGGIVLGVGLVLLLIGLI